MKNTLSFLFLILVSSLSCSVQKTLKKEADIIIHQVNIVDVVDGKIIPDQSVVIQGSTIIDVLGEKTQTYNATKVVNGKGQYLIPGLWDMHAHYSLLHTFSNPLLIANGVTGIREMWGIMDTIKEIRQQTANGTLVAPDIYSAGNVIDGVPPIWPGTIGARNEKVAKEEVEKQIAEGVDFIKIYTRLSAKAYQAIAKISQTSKIPFAGHIPDAVSIWEAIDANQQSFEHMYGVLEACSTHPDSVASFTGFERFGPARMNFLVDTYNPNLFDSLATELANSNTWISPTLTVLHSIATMDDSTKLDDPRMEYMPPFMQHSWNPKNDFRFKYNGPEYYTASRRQFKLEQSLVGELANRGAKIIAGTDYSNPFCYPGFSLHDELALLVESGMSPADALKAATFNPVVFMKKEQTQGQVAVGQLASLVLLKENPLKNISHTKNIQGVFLRGQYFDRAQLDAMLVEAKVIAAKTENPFGY